MQLCKKRIETVAAKVQGVSYVSWNEDLKVLTIKYSIFKKDVPENVQKIFLPQDTIQKDLQQVTQHTINIRNVTAIKENNLKNLPCLSFKGRHLISQKTINHYLKQTK